jgi:hypothetical protein
MYVVSSNVWYGGGHLWSHSRFVVSSTTPTSRFEANASQIMKTIIITSVREMKESTDDTVFHAV